MADSPNQNGGPDRPRQTVEHFDFMMDGIRVVGTHTKVYNPETVRQVDEFIIGCIIRRLPEIRAQMEREEALAKKQEGSDGS